MKHLLFAFMLLAIKSTGQDWKPNPKYIAPKDTAAAARPVYKYQCYGTTKKGERCKRKVEKDHSFCYQHANQAE